MKRNLLCYCALLISFKTAAQIPNAGFETWFNAGTYEEPVDWTSYNQYTQFASVAAVSKTTDAHSGTYAALAETKSFFNSITSMQDTVPGIMVTGTDVLSSVNGFPYILRPDSLSAWYKYTPAGGDFGGIGIILSKWNNSSGARDYIASGEISIMATAATYTYGSVPLSYFMPDSPDTAFVYASASNGSIAFPGSALTVDDISLVTITAVDEVHANQVNLITAYPNPAREKIKFNSRSALSFSVSVYDLTGRMISSFATDEKLFIEVDLTGYEAGLYLFTARKKDGSVSSSGKFCVIK